MKDVDKLCVNTLRFLAVDAIEQAKSGHPGLPLGAAPMAYVLWDRFLRHNPKTPSWINYDRFILSAGHGSALLYALFHVYDYGLPVEELKNSVNGAVYIIMLKTIHIIGLPLRMNADGAPARILLVEDRL